MRNPTDDVGRHDEAPARRAGFTPSRPVGSFAYCVRGVLLTPRAFFSGLPEREGALRPLLFALLAALLSKAADLTLSLPNQPSIAPRGILFHAADALLALLITAVVAHVVFRILTGKEGGHVGFGRTARVVCYASATVLLAPVPIVGTIAGLYGFWLISVGLRAARGEHRDGGSRS